MMKYLRIDGGQIEYPFRVPSLRDVFPNVSFPQEPTVALLAEYGIYPVSEVPPPVPALTQDVEEVEPQQVNGAWTQAWTLVDVSPEEAARRQREATDRADAQAVKVDAFVRNFITMTPAQVSDYVNNNTANLAQTRALLNKMALMLLALARRKYR